MPQWADWNIDSRLDLVHAIVDGHTLRIDQFHWNTWDKAVFQGHFYSDKAPGTAFLGTVVYAGYALARRAPLSSSLISALERNNAWRVPIALGRSDTQNAPAAKGRVLGGCQRGGAANVQYIPWGNRLVPPMRDWALSKYVVTIGVDAFLSALFAAFLYWFLAVLGIGPRSRLAATLLYALGTTALPYSSNFYSHQLSAALLFGAFAFLVLWSRGWNRRWLIPAAGFFLGFAFLTEYTVAVIIALVGLYGLWLLRGDRGGTLSFVAASAVPLMALFAYNYACFGNPLDTGYTHDFCWSPAQSAGIAGFTSPQLGPLFDLTFGSFRGLFYLSPFLLLTLPGAFLMARKGLAREAALCLTVSISFILVLSAYWGWNGGRVDGPRYLVPIIPFLAFPAAFFIDRAGSSMLNRAIVAVTGAWSLAAMWIIFLGGPTFPISWLRDPIQQFSLPALRRGDITSNAGLFFGLSGWASLVPLLIALLVGCSAWWAWSRMPSASEPPMARLAAAGSSDRDS